MTLIIIILVQFYLLLLIILWNEKRPGWLLQITVRVATHKMRKPAAMLKHKSRYGIVIARGSSESIVIDKNDEPTWLLARHEHFFALLRFGIASYMYTCRIAVYSTQIVQHHGLHVVDSTS